ncbi:hypothetical protein DACRYDRAFT_116954 [Dacryopinax primogenitus]|uniref:Chalcone isomerase domain-containing protein n=1 Tax=Dacryopinax primogenitus (strain DJM 731) TaxID=1858805 RepID=M5FZ43_DACPD|nr:uncharacterized protein DACRYDRAFT_116954 [Dacryopinax primogenitus]EJU01150.1 hypothetical protein DACRYDRAFT_116954 [Dacryopinax primogenitus]
MASRVAWSLLRSPVLPVSVVLFTAHTLYRPHVALDAPPKPKRAKEPTASELFPPTLPHPSGATLTLLGTGIRTVTFMRMKVYEVGFYADLSEVALEEGEKSAAERMKGLLEGGDVLLRIVPSRRTNFTHLRDGFIKALQHRVALLPSRPPESTQLAVGKLLTLFPNAPMSTTSTLDVAYFHPGPTSSQQGTREWKSNDGSKVARWSWKSGKTEGWPDAWVLVGCDGRELGRIEDGWVAREWVLAYFDASREISKGLRDGVGKRLNDLAKEGPAVPTGEKPVKLNWVS